VLQHLKGDKVIVFKRKEEKDTKETVRQYLTQIVMKVLLLVLCAKKAAPKSSS
jgi:ribosomal protein L21